MRIARAETDDGIVTGEYKNGAIITEAGSYELENDEALLAPSTPSVFYCVGRNYPEYPDSTETERTEYFHWFLKPAVSRADPNGIIPYPSFANELGCAGELAAVIGKESKNLTEDTVKDAVLGFTVMNDLDAEDQPEVSSRKAFDHAAPFGPWIETDVDPTDLDMRTEINNEIVTEANTSQMFWGPWEVIVDLSRRMTLKEGDVIAFGSPGSPRTLEPGDKMEMWYEGIGTLRNTIGEKKH